MATTIFVKQRKKSSNKWTCVVCNQKQSVLKVFAQGPMAKDLRKFVQSFNMSRKVSDQNQPFDPTLEYDINFEDYDDDGGGGGGPENQKKRRTDWTEYLDPDDHHDHKLVLQEEEQGHKYGDGFEPKIVTELPPMAKFKKPKLNNYEIEEGGDHQLYKPVFSKRNIRKDTMFISQDEKPMEQQQAIGEESIRDCKQATIKGNSKWKDYITQDDAAAADDDGDFGCCSRRKFPDHMNKWGDAVLETESKYEMVEDDIHPDFV
ncbi:hypothetical protein REPUB_Repub16aG0009100 [Reevesia pubescens]